MPLTPDLHSFGRPAPRPSGSSAARLAWVDAARALAIVTVVLLHVSIGHFYGLPQADGRVVPAWDRINQVVAVMRMPLLFVVSGMLAAGKIRRGFTKGNAWLGAATNYYLYLVWLAVYGLLFLASGPIDVPFEPARWRDYWIQIVEPRTPLWFVFGLACYMVLFTAVRKLPAWIVLGASAAISLWSALIWTVESPLWTRAFLYVVFFAVGVYGRKLVIERADSWWVLGLGAAASVALYFWLTLETIMSVEVLDLGQAVLSFALQGAACVLALSASAKLCRLRWYRVAGSWIGRRTLGIYVMHVPVIVVVHLLVEMGPLHVIRDLTGRYWVFETLYPVLLTAFVVVVCVMLENLLGAARLAHLFRFPSRFRRQLYRRPDGTRVTS